MKPVTVYSVVILLLVCPSVDSKDCIVNDFRVQPNFDVSLYQGKWYLVSLTSFWSGLHNRNGNGSIGNGQERPKSWGDNANRFFGRWDRNSNGVSSGNTTGRPSFPGVRGSARTGSSRPPQPPHSSFPRGVSNSPPNFPTPPSNQGPARGRQWSQRQQSQSSTGDANENQTLNSNQRLGMRGGPMGGNSQGRGPGQREQRWGARMMNGSRPNPRNWWRRGRGNWGPKNMQVVYSLRADTNLDVYIAGDIMGRCIYSKGQGTITNIDQPAKIHLTFPTRMFLPCQPYWVIKTDYEGYAVIYYCLQTLEDGTCDPKMATVWTLNRKQTGHTLEEQELVEKAVWSVCIDPSDLHALPQGDTCDIDKEHVELHKNEGPRMVCGDTIDRKSTRVQIEMPYQLGSAFGQAAGQNSASSFNGKYLFKSVLLSVISFFFL